MLRLVFSPEAALLDRIRHVFGDGCFCGEPLLSWSFSFRLITIAYWQAVPCASAFSVTTKRDRGRSSSPGSFPEHAFQTSISIKVLLQRFPNVHLVFPLCLSQQESNCMAPYPCVFSAKEVSLFCSSRMSLPEFRAFPPYSGRSSSFSRLCQTFCTSSLSSRASSSLPISLS